MVGRRKVEWRGKEREGNKANLSPTSVSPGTQCWPGAQTLQHHRLRSREDCEGGGRAGEERRAERGKPEKAGVVSPKASPPARPSLLISPSISHTYIYFFSNSPPSPTTNHHNRSAAHAYCMQGVGLYFQTFCKETTRIFHTTHITPHPHPQEITSIYYVILFL